MLAGNPRAMVVTFFVAFSSAGRFTVQRRGCAQVRQTATRRVRRADLAVGETVILLHPLSL